MSRRTLETQEDEFFPSFQLADDFKTFSIFLTFHIVFKSNILPLKSCARHYKYV